MVFQPILRVYTKDFDPEKGIWIVDEGDPTTSKRFEKVIIRATCYTSYDLTQDNEYFPKSWLEIPEGKLKIINRMAVIK